MSDKKKSLSAQSLTSQKLGDQAFRLEDNKQVWREMTYAGVLSFLRRRYTRTLKNVDVAVSGIPYDGATTNRSGARFGPQAIRAASVQLAELSAFPYGFNPLEHLSVIDYGDCYLDPHHPNTVVDSIEKHAETLLSHSVKMLTFGGDHFVSYPILKAYAKKYGAIALLHIDAHSDTWQDEPDRLDHGTMFRRAVSEGIIDVKHSVQVGLRTYNRDDCGFEIITSPWIHRHGIDKTIDLVNTRVAKKPLYISFDIDALDPAFAPGTGTPVVGGLTSAQAMTLIQGLKDNHLIGMDVVEVAPAYDHNEITALAAATMAYQWLCLLALQKGAKPNFIGHV